MSWTQKSYIAVALEPLHIGTGGQRLGRVDLTVVREPMTNVPKIPGTTFSGALKFFADLSLRDQGVKTEICASTQGSKNKNHVWSKCPICCAFGYTPQNQKGADDQTASAQGLLQFSDALLLAYPVNTLVGPVWLTTKPRLKSMLGVTDGKDDCDEAFLLPDESEVKSPLADKLNIGSVLLSQGNTSCPSTRQLQQAGLPERYACRTVIVSEWVFSHLVNDNMEVRTSVVINPETGAADSGGLFTYEAVGRGAIFAFSITENDYAGKWESVEWTKGDKPADCIALLNQNAFAGIKAVGLGGMTTRGFGRLDIHEITAREEA